MLFGLIGIRSAPYPFVWELVGMINAVFGVGYILGSLNPIRRWPVLAVGFLSKLFGSLGFLYYAYLDAIQPSFGYNVFTNDIIWIFPLGYALYLAYLDFIYEPDLGMGDEGLPMLMQIFTNQHGQPLQSISDEQPVMLIFLRHFGCTFCREALDDLARKHHKLSRTKRIVLVHMADDAYAHRFLRKYGLEHLDRISDPDCHLYKAFGLQRARLNQIFGFGQWWRVIKAGLFRGHFAGKLVGDSFRLPGIFVLYRNTIVRSFYHRNASERPDYEQLASCPVQKVPDEMISSA
jgi:peroxiredoxin